MKHQSNSAVSPVVAVILMVAVTVIISAAVGVFVFDLGTMVNDDPKMGDAGVQVVQNSTHVSITVISAESPIYYQVNGSEAKIGTAGDAVLLQEGTDYYPGDSIDIINEGKLIQTIETESSTG